MKQILKSALAVASVLIGTGIAAPVLAKSPYYFVDNLNNKQPVFTDSGCTGAYVTGCRYFGKYCDRAYWVGDFTARKALEMWNDHDGIYIRENWSPYNTICVLDH